MSNGDDLRGTRLPPRYSRAPQSCHPVGGRPGPTDVLKNVATYSVSAVATGCMFLLLVLAGRYLGAEDFGRFSFALALGLLFEPLLDPGLYHYSIREMARDRAATGRFLAHAVTWKTTVALPVFLVVAGVVAVMHDSPTTRWAVYLMTASAILKSYKDSLRSALLAHEWFGMDALTLVIERMALLSIGALVLLSGHGVIALCLVFVGIRAADLILVASIVRARGIPVRMGNDVPFLLRMVRGALPLGAVYITLNVYNYVDIVMLSAFRPETEVGWYGASYRIYEGLLIAPGVVAMVLMPRLSRLAKGSPAAFHKLFADGLKHVIILALALSATASLASASVVPVVFGPSFAPSVVSLNVLLIGLAFAFSLNFLQISMIAVDLQKTVFSVTLAGLGLNVLLNLALIPRLGQVGAAVSTVAVEALVLGTLLRLVRRTPLGVDVWRLYGVPTTAMGAALAPSLWMAAEHWIIAVVSFNALFMGLLFASRVLGPREVAAIAALVRPPRRGAIQPS